MTIAKAHLGGRIPGWRLRRAEQLARDQDVHKQLVALARQASALVGAVRRDASRGASRGEQGRRALRKEASGFLHRLDRRLQVAESRPTHRRRNAALVVVLALAGGLAAAAAAIRPGLRSVDDAR
jgi:hypothetical protein